MQKHVKRDEGWAWVVVVAGFLTYLLVFGIVSSNGIVYSGLLELFGDAHSSTAWVPFIMQSVMNAFSLLAGYLGRKISYRFTVVLGGLLASVGLVLSFFAPTIPFLYFTYGCVLGMGLGFTISPTVVIVGLYFDRHRALANGICFSGSSVGAIVITPLYHWLVETYKLRGAFLIVSGLVLNVCVFGALFRPPPPIIEQTSVHEDENLKLMGDSIKPAEPKTESERVETNENGRFLTDDTHDLDNRLVKLSNSSSKRKFWKRGDLQFLLNGIFVLVAFGWGFIMLSYASILLMLPDFAANELEVVSKSNAAFLISVIAIGDLVGRVAFGWIIDRKYFRNKHGCTATFCAGGLLLMVMPEATTYASLVACCLVYGVANGASLNLQPILLVEYLGLRGFQRTFGYLGLFAGLIIITFSTAVGTLRDITGSYASSMRLNGGFLMMMGLLWFTEPLILRLQPFLTPMPAVKNKKLNTEAC